jgi:transglutaminase-like putative cysteine protease
VTTQTGAEDQLDAFVSKPEKPAIDWNLVQTATLEVTQSFHYEYPGPVEDLRQLLVLVPPDELPGQRLVSHVIGASPAAPVHEGFDRFGNRVSRLAFASLDRSLELSVWFVVRRWRAADARTPEISDVEAFLQASPLTEASPQLVAFAGEIAGNAPAGRLVETISSAVHRSLTYLTGSTGIETTAADAFGSRSGVCQDFSHVMIAVCKLLGLPARYISGHLLGEGAMHAWVEVLTPTGGSTEVWRAFDPTHDVRADLRYVTVARGRDFGDVSPTRGTFRAPYAGRLVSSSRTARLLSLT